MAQKRRYDSTATVSSRWVPQTPLAAEDNFWSDARGQVQSHPRRNYLVNIGSYVGPLLLNGPCCNICNAQERWLLGGVQDRSNNAEPKHGTNAGLKALIHSEYAKADSCNYQHSV